MSDLVTRFAYDPTGTNPDNLITNEPHSLSNNAVRAFAPIYGPFFTDNAIVIDGATEQILTKGTQYQFVELLNSVTLQTGKEICCLVLILDTNVSANVRFTYQAVGGLYQNEVAEGIINLYETVAADTRNVDWKNILNKPLTFPPTDHNHSLNDVTGWMPVVSILERVRNAIMLSDVPVYEAMLDYFNELAKTLQVDVANEKLIVESAVGQVDALAAALQSEITRAQNAEQSEAQRAIDAETTLNNNLSAAIQAETLRATTAENLKVNILDIVDNLTSTATNKPLSANQGKVLYLALQAEISRAQSVESGKVNSTLINAANGIAGLDTNGYLYNNATTQDYGTANDKIATCGFVDRIRDVKSSLQAADYILQLSDRGCSVDTTANVIVPASTTVAFPVGSVVTITNIGANPITISPDTNVTLRLGGTVLNGVRTLSGYGVATFRCVPGTDTWIGTGAGLS